MCKVYTSYCGTSEIEHGLCACTADNPRALKLWDYLSVQAHKPCSISHILKKKLIFGQRVCLHRLLSLNIKIFTIFAINHLKIYNTKLYHAEPFSLSIRLT